MITKQPKIVTVKKDKQDSILSSLPDGPLECKLQDRDPEDNSKVVYVSNPVYVKDSKNSVKGSPYVALTSYEYEVVEEYDPEAKPEAKPKRKYTRKKKEEA